jgi:hypothetical protein
MVIQCFPCDRPFKDQQALDQHIRDSSIHKRYIPQPAQAQVPTPLQSADFRISISSPCQPTHLQQLYTAASSPSSSQNMENGQNGTYYDKKSPWSVIPIFQQPALLEALRIHCHSPEDLLENKYLLYPYTPQDLDGFRKCINCGGKSQGMQFAGILSKLYSSAKEYAESKPSGMQIPPCGEKFYGLCSPCAIWYQY